MANPSTPAKGKEETRTHTQGHATPGHGADRGRGDDDLLSKAKDAAGTVADKARDLASSATRTAGDALSAVGDRAESATSAMGSGMQSLAGTIRENAPREGMFGRASSAVAEGLDSSGRYLQQEGFGGMMDDLSQVIRRNPLPAVLLGIGLGFLVARVTRS